jgi:hypothetical protein
MKESDYPAVMAINFQLIYQSYETGGLKCSYNLNPCHMDRSSLLPLLIYAVLNK